MSDAEEPKIETWEEAADAILGLFGKRFRSIGAFEIYRGKRRGQRMANLRLLL